MRLLGSQSSELVSESWRSGLKREPEEAREGFGACEEGSSPKARRKGGLREKVGTKGLQSFSKYRGPVFLPKVSVEVLTTRGRNTFRAIAQSVLTRR